MSQRAPAPPGPPLVGQPLVVLGVAAVLGSLASLAPWPCLLALLVWLCSWARGIRWALLCLLAFLLAGVLAEGKRRTYRHSWQEQARALAGHHRCALSGVVTSSPTARQALSPAASVGSEAALDESFLLLATAGACGDRTIPARTLVAVTKGGAGQVARGDEIELVADLGPLRLFRNAALANPFDAAARRGAVLSGRILTYEVIRRGSGVAAAIDHARARVRARIRATYSGPAVALGRALVLGENDLDAQDDEAFRKSGLMHLLAVSGTHLVIAVLALVGGLRALLVRVGGLVDRRDPARWSAAVGFVLSLLYADFAGGSGSAWRAAYMLALMLGARSFGARLGGGAALGGSLLVALALDPLAASDVSFLLSALATAGLIGIGQPLGRLVLRGPVARFPLQPLAMCFVATLSATIACAPLLALLDGRMTLAALGANVVAGPLGELLALPACLLHAVAAACPALETGLALVGSGALLCVRAVALWSARQESVQFMLPMPDVWQRVEILIAFVVAPQALGCVGALFRRPGSGWLGLVAGFAGSLLPLGLLRVAAGPCTGPARLAITALDVDQGDALVVDFPDGRLGLVDGGGFATGLPDTGQRVLLPYVRARGRAAVDLMILSHAHPDHLLGLASVAEALPVRELWLLAPHGGGPDVQRLVVAVRRSGGRVRGPAELCPERAPAAVTTFGGAELAVLVPCDADQAWASSGENDRSLVVHLRYRDRSVLLTGDIEQEGEARLVTQHRPRLRADLLKVPHHGSDTSSGQSLLDGVGASVAFISCGVRNRFEHPRPSVLDRLQQHGVLTLRTDRLGSISWLTDGMRTWFRGFEGELTLGRPPR